MMRKYSGSAACAAETKPLVRAKLASKIENFMGRPESLKWSAKLSGNRPKRLDLNQPSQLIFAFTNTFEPQIVATARRVSARL
jgi:hypothetical protein